MNCRHERYTLTGQGDEFLLRCSACGACVAYDAQSLLGRGLSADPSEAGAYVQMLRTMLPEALDAVPDGQFKDTLASLMPVLDSFTDQVERLGQEEACRLISLQLMHTMSELQAIAQREAAD